MKRFAFAALALTVCVPVFAAATNLCTGDATAGDKPVTGGANFIKNSFNMKCSANVFLAYDESTVTAVSVGAASKKGKNNFGGTSEGGAVTKISECTGGVCTAAPTPPAIGGTGT